MEEKEIETYEALDDIVTEIEGVLAGDREFQDKARKIEVLMMEALTIIDEYNLDRFKYEEQQLFL